MTKKKYNLVKWNQVIQDQEHEGIGVRSAKLMNRTFGGNIMWRFINGNQTWWKKVLEVKYLNFT